MRSVVLWELRAKSGMPATCSLQQVEGRRFALDVTIGPNEILRETFQREPDALSHACFLRLDFVEQGWIETFRCDD